MVEPHAGHGGADELGAITVDMGQVGVFIAERWNVASRSMAPSRLMPCKSRPSW